MKGITSFGAVCALASTVLASPAVQKRSVPTVTVSGNAFFANGERFYIRGVDYQPGGSSDAVDPIANAQTCQRDIALFKQLGINTIRVYSVDNSANHDTCMNALADAGIYLALDVNNGAYSLNRADPGPSYNNVYLQSVFATIDAFAKYDNTLLFFSGNEVINAADNTDCAPYIKAVTRDMKNYIKSMSYRQIPVGYSAADVESNRYQTAVYMNCGSDGMARSDFFAFNDYSWCDPSSFTTSGWDQKVQEYGNYSIPIFLSEFGCITNPPRDFGEVQALYNSEMTSVYSGGLVYEYSEESSNPGYGIVNIESTTSANPKNPEFNNLMKMYKANPAPTGDGGYKTNGEYFTECPAYSSTWEVKMGDGLPAIPAPALKYFKSGAGKGPGLDGPGSQNAGTQSTSIVTSVSNGTTFPSSTSDPSNDSTSSSPTNNAAPSLRAAEWATGPVASIAIVVISSFLGATLL